MGRRWLPFSLVLSLVAGCAQSIPDQVRRLNEEGIHLLQGGAYAEAQRRFEEAHLLLPEDPVLMYNLANAAHQNGDLATAEHWYRQSLQRRPDLAPCRHGLALLLFQTDRGQEARDMIVEWLRHNPNLADAHAQYGWLLRQEGDLPAAQAHLQKALELDPGCTRALIELGILYEAYHYPERARELYQRVLRRHPQQPEASARLAALRPSR